MVDMEQSPKIPRIAGWWSTSRRAITPVAALAMLLGGCALHRGGITAGPTGAAPPPPPPPPASPSVSLTAIPSTANRGEPVTLEANCAGGTGITGLHWSASAGTISGTGSTATLDTNGVSPGPITVTVVCSDSHGLTASAATEINLQAAAPPPAGIIDTGRGFILPGDHEAPGYGMYSYLLWRYKPDPSDRARYETVIAAFLRMPTIAAEEGTQNVPNAAGQETAPAMPIAKENLNIAYIPVDSPPPADASADWVLLHYDLNHARRLLDQLPHDYESGPYIVSTMKPLSGGLAADSHYLFQDLSAPVVPSVLASAWIRAFQEQAKKQEFWKPDKMQKFVLDLRAEVAELAVEWPDAKNGLTTWIGWLPSSGAGR